MESDNISNGKSIEKWRRKTKGSSLETERQPVATNTFFLLYKGSGV